MPDFEIVMKALECCSHPNGTLCVKCPYLHANDLPHNMPPCIGKLTRDVCALLKEQETVVRCKDCKHRPTPPKAWGAEINGQWCYWCELHRSWEPDDWYCADGERW